MLGLAIAVHQALARTEDEEAAGVWLMRDESEAASISDPLANIAQRHSGNALVNPDAGDLIAAGVATAGYAIHNTLTAFKIRRNMRRSMNVEHPTEDDEGAQE